MQSPALLPVTAFILAIAGYWLSLAVFPKFKLLDFPGRYGLKRKPIPYPAGIIAILVFVGIFLATQSLDFKGSGMLAAVAMLGAISFIDDRTPLPSWLRLAVQILVAIIVFASGSRIYSLTNPLGGILELDTVVFATPFGPLPFWSGVFTIGWLVLTVNAMNWLDGIPGQVSVLSFIGFLMLGLLALYRNGEPEIAQLAFILAAIAAAGCFFDFPPAKVLLGDTGSMFFGFMLGLLGVYSGGKVATVLLALGIPLLDALFVIVRRLAKGHSPFKGGRDHLHHLLLAKGWSERKVIAMTALMGALFGVTALFLSTAQKGIAVGVLVLVVLGLTVYAGKGRK